MKVTKEYLKRVVKEELSRVLNEGLPEAAQKYTFVKNIKFPNGTLGLPTTGMIPQGHYYADSQSEKGYVNIMKQDGTPMGPAIKQAVFQKLAQVDKAIVIGHVNYTPSREEIQASV